MIIDHHEIRYDIDLIIDNMHMKYLWNMMKKKNKMWFLQEEAGQTKLHENRH